MCRENFRILTKKINSQYNFPKKVTRLALENAASVAGMILTTECALVDIKEDAPSGGMPGMM
ncbi:MAG: hypothetical protein ACPGU6_04450 [Tenacibaculum sp.]